MIRPGILEEMLSGTYEGIPLTEVVFLYFSLIWLIPLAMAFLSLTLKGSVIRWANIVLTIIWEVLWVIDTVEGGLLLAQYLINIAMLVVSSTILWYSWNWPKEES
jgi:hypothetical protein